MKNKIKNISIAIVVIAVICAVALVGNRVNASADENAKAKQDNKFFQKSVYDDKDDGWVYAFEIVYFDSGDENIYMFDGYNLKYKELDGYYVPIIDKETGEIIDKVKPNYITQSISEAYREDIKNIVEFFNKKQFNDKITVKDLEGLEFKVVSKEYLVDIFNRTISSKLMTEPGEYFDDYFVSRVNVDSTDKAMKGEWQISYILNYGHLYDVNIEFIDESGRYLSDVAKSKSATAKDLELFAQVEVLEKAMVEKQTLAIDLAKSSIKLDSKTGSDITKLLNNLASEVK